MTTTKITLLVPTGIRHIEEGNLRGCWYRWKQVPTAPEVPWSWSPHKALFRFWVGSTLIGTHRGWPEAPQYYLYEWLKDMGILLRWFDTIVVYPIDRWNHCEFIDVYIKSSILEKLYANK